MGFEKIVRIRVGGSKSWVFGTPVETVEVEKGYLVVFGELRSGSIENLHRQMKVGVTEVGSDP